MSEQILYISENTKTYSEALKSFVRSVFEELESGVKDGLAYQLSKADDNETEVFNFIKSQGFDIKYKEFFGFYEDCQEMIKANAELLESMPIEEEVVELDDTDLEQVAGGSGWWKKNWKKVAIGAGAALVVGAALVATGGLAAPIIGASVAAGGGMLPVIATGVIAAHSGLAAGCAIAAGAGGASIAAGALG